MAIVQSAGQLAATEDRGGNAGTRATSSVALYNQRRQTYAQILKSQPNVRTVVSFIARNIAQLGTHLFERVSDTDRQRRRDHPFEATLRQPNPADRRLTRFRLIHRTMWDLAAFDAAFWGLLPLRGVDRSVILPLPVARMEIQGHMWPTLYRFHGRRGPLDLRPDQVVHFQGSHDGDSGLWGISPIESLRRVLAEDDAAGIYREQFWRSGARVSGLIERPADAPEWSPEAKARFETSWRQAWSGLGAGAGGTPILEDGMSFKEGASVDARSAQYVEARKLSREEAAALWHIDPLFVGIRGTGEAFASVKERHKSLYQDDLGPWIVMLEEDLTAQALPAFETNDTLRDRLYVKLNIAEKLRGAPEELAESLTKLTGRPILEANEARGLLELNDHEDGSGLVVPLNVLVGGQTSPGAPAPGTANRPTPARTGTKAVGPTVAQYAAATNPHRAAAAAVLARTFNRQKAEVLAELGAAGDTVTADDVFDRERWDAELAVDLLGLGLDLGSDVANLTAESLAFDGVDVDAFIPFLEASTTAAAAGINTATRNRIEELLAGDEAGDALGEMFTIAASARAAQIAQTRTTAVAGFAARDTARQAGRASKVWVVTSQESRHPGLDGETVPIGSAFSNGLQWPGDGAGSVDEIAGCTCILRFD